MKQLVLIMFALSTSYTSGALANEHRNCFRFGGQRACFHELGGSLLSMDCQLTKERIYACAAAKALAKAPGLILDADELEGGKNPGAVLCQKLGGRIVIGNDRFGNQESFCAFDDKSMTTSASLAYAQERARAAQSAAKPKPAMPAAAAPKTSR